MKCIDDNFFINFINRNSKKDRNMCDEKGNGSIGEAPPVMEYYSKEPFEFKVGDYVEAFGIKTKIKEIGGHKIYPILVLIDDRTYSFTKSGMHYDWHQQQTLKFLSREKKKVKKWKFLFKISHDGGWNETKRYYLDDTDFLNSCYGFTVLTQRLDESEKEFEE